MIAGFYWKVAHSVVFLLVLVVSQLLYLKLYHIHILELLEYSDPNLLLLSLSYSFHYNFKQHLVENQANRRRRALAASQESHAKVLSLLNLHLRSHHLSLVWLPLCLVSHQSNLHLSSP